MPTSRSSAPSIQSLGAMLRERREAMGVTLAEVEVATRIRQKYLAALESEEWHLLPGEVVGRGFLRNYADYLGLDPNEVMERRRAVVDANLMAALSTTSAGAPLPPERAVDYRPKEVDLKDETDDIKRGEIRLAPLLGMVALAALVALGWWGFTSLSDPISDVLAGAQTRVVSFFDRSEPEEPTPPPVAGIINEQNLPGAAGAVTGTQPSPALTPSVVILGGDAQGAGEAPAPAAVAPSADQVAGETISEAVAPPAEEPPAGQVEPPAGEQPAGEQPLDLLVPTPTPDTVAQPEQPPAEPPTPTPEPPTPTPELPTPEPPTPTPELPTPTPEPPTPEPPPPPIAAACADPRAVITGVGQGQVISGIAGISGTAQHENFQFYKLEYAPGANAAGGFVYFDGSNTQVVGGLLGNLDTRLLPNGEYTIRLTVVDQTSNFPPPCDVTVVVQN